MKTTDRKLKIGIKEVKWTGWIAILLPLALLPLPTYFSWSSNSDIHSMLEFGAALTAIVASVMVLLFFFTTGNRMHIVIGIGFILQGFEDLIHAFYSFERLWGTKYDGVDPAIPATYISGRLLMALFLLIALIYIKKEKVTDYRKRVKMAYKYLGVSAVIGLVLPLIIIQLPKLNFFYPDKFISRPYDLLIGLLFLISFIRYNHLYSSKNFKSPIISSIAASALLGFITQLYMTPSLTFYDSYFDIAHVLKIFSYIVIVFGVWGATLQLYKNSLKQVVEINNSISAFEQRIESLMKENKTLKQKLGPDDK